MSGHSDFTVVLCALIMHEMFLRQCCARRQIWLLLTNDRVLSEENLHGHS